MNDKEFAKQQRRVQALARRWQPVILQDYWRVEYVWHRGPFESSGLDGDVLERRIADATADWRYCHATIQWNLEAAWQEDDEALERTVIHELCHLALAELRHGISDEAFNTARWVAHEEHVVTLLAVAFAEARRG